MERSMIPENRGRSVGNDGMTSRALCDTSTLGDEIRRALVRANPRLSRFNPLERIVSFDDFDLGLCGWSELIGNYAESLDTPAGGPYSGLEMEMRPPMLSTLSMWDVGTVGSMDGTYAMKIATLPKRGHLAHPAKRVSIGGRALLQLEGYFTFKPEASKLDLSSGTAEAFRRHSSGRGELAVHSFGFGYDVQDEEERYWPGIRFLHAENGELVERWQWHAGGVRHPHLDGWVDIPNGQQRLPYNEIPTKHNWIYVRWLIDLLSREYVELQCNDHIFDLRGKRYVYRNIHPEELQYTPYMTGEHPIKPRLWGMLNLDCFVQTNEDRRCFLYLDSLLLSSSW